MMGGVIADDTGILGASTVVLFELLPLPLADAVLLDEDVAVLVFVLVLVTLTGGGVGRMCLGGSGRSGLSGRSGSCVLQLSSPLPWSSPLPSVVAWSRASLPLQLLASAGVQHSASAIRSILSVLIIFSFLKERDNLLRSPKCRLFS